MRILGINAVYHDPSVALVVNGKTVAAAEEERFSRRKHGKRPVPFSAWELPELAARWALRHAGLSADDLDGFERRTGLPVVVNTSLNTAGRPMLDSPRDALECFGSTPVDLLAIGPFALRRVAG